MIFQIYTAFFLLTLIILFLGYYSKVDSIKILGYGSLFVLGIILLGYGDTLEYKSGEIINNNMACGGCYETRFSNTTGNITGFYVASTSQTDIYSDYTNKTLGFLLSTLAFLGWLSVYFDIRGRN